MVPMSGKRKFRIVSATYMCALVAALGIFSYVSRRNLNTCRSAALYSAQEAFEETVTSVDHLSAALQKSVYATDGSMCAKICAQVYADALAAEAAMSTLPFSTQELEQISGYINQVGDYAYTLCAESAQSGFTQEQAENLAGLSELASSLASSLRQLQTDYHNRAVEMDSHELRLRNVGVENTGGRISAELLRFESEFPRRASLEYDGKYGASQRQSSGKSISDAEKLAAAAGFAGVSPAEVRLTYDYEGSAGLKCYTAGDMLIVVGNSGVVSAGRSRLISEARISPEKAQEIAWSFLEKRGYSDMTLTDTEQIGGALTMKFVSSQDGALCLDNFIRLSVALDDGSICSFNAENYSDAPCRAAWDVSETEAGSAIPASLELREVKKVIIRTAGKRALACYEFDCADSSGKNVRIYVDASTGRQTEIVV